MRSYIIINKLFPIPTTTFLFYIKTYETSCQPVLQYQLRRDQRKYLMKNNLRNLIDNMKSGQPAGNLNEQKASNQKQIQKQRSLNYSSKRPPAHGDSISEHGSASRHNQGSQMSRKQFSQNGSQNSMQNGQSLKQKNLISPAVNKSLPIGVHNKNQPPQLQRNQSLQSQGNTQGVGSSKYINRSGPPKNSQSNIKIQLRDAKDKSVSSVLDRSNEKSALDKRNGFSKHCTSPNLRQTHLNYQVVKRDKQQTPSKADHDPVFKDWVQKQSSAGRHSGSVQTLNQQKDKSENHESRDLKRSFTPNGSDGKRSQMSIDQQLKDAPNSQDHEKHLNNMDKSGLQRSSGKPTLKEQILKQTSESNKSLIEYMNSDILRATLDPQATIQTLFDQQVPLNLMVKSNDQSTPQQLPNNQNQNNNYNKNSKQNGASTDSQLIAQQTSTREGEFAQEPTPVEQYFSNDDTQRNVQRLEQNIQNFRDSCSVAEPAPPFYVVEKQELLQNTQQLKKRLFIQQQQQSGAIPTPAVKPNSIQGQWEILHRFITVSKVVLNQLEKFLHTFRDAFINQVVTLRDSRIAVHLQKYFQEMDSADFDNDAVLTQQILEMANECKSLFLEVYETFLSGKLSPSDECTKLNLTSIKHCLKRIFKACQIQLDDFQWKNGPYRESQFTTAGQEDEAVDDEQFLSTVRQRTKLLTDVIEVEQVAKLYLDLYKKNFYQVYEQCVHTMLNIVIFDNEQVYYQTMCFNSNEMQYEFFNRVRTYFQKFSQYSNFCNPPIALKGESTSLSVIQQFFTAEDLEKVTQENLLLISLLEMGNTVDGVAIAAKILKDQFKESQRNVYGNFQTFQQSFKKRKCHCCMEYILDAGKAVTCANIINQVEPCLNLYCQNCIVSFMEEKHHYDDAEASKRQQPPEANEEEPPEKKIQREKEEKITRHKLWLKACENILFVCPCCQGYCLNEKLTDAKREFSQFSVCNFNFKLEHHPRSFLRRDVYWYKVQGINRVFYLAKIVGLNKQKQMHKIEVVENSQTYQVKLSREELFFTQTVQKGTKIFDIIDKQGPQLDIHAQINKQIKDFKKFETKDIFDRFINHVDKFDKDKSKFAVQDGFIVPKFQYPNASQTSRGDFLQTHRQLHRRYDHQIYEQFTDCNIEQLCQSNAIENQQIKGKQTPQQEDQEMTPADPSQDIKNESEQESENKEAQAVDDSKKVKPEIKFVTPQDISIGQKMILEKNFQLAKEQGGDQFCLLITKEVFKVEKVSRTPTPILNAEMPISPQPHEQTEEEEDTPIKEEIPERNIHFKGASECSMPYVQSGTISPEQNWVANILPFETIQSQLKEIQDQQDKSNEREKKRQEPLRYSFKDYEPKQYNLRRPANEIRPVLGKRLIFQPTVKQHVEEGFFDDWPEEIIKQYKLRVSRKRASRRKPEEPTPQVASEESSQAPKPEAEPLKLFKRKFILTQKLQEDCDQSKLVAIHQPEEIPQLFIYIYREETKIWRRALVKVHFEGLLFNVEYQDSKRSIRKVDLGKCLFFIDQEHEVKSDQRADKIVNMPLFNNKNKVKKLLSQVWPNLSGGNQEQVKIEEGPELKRQKTEETGIKEEQLKEEKIVSISLPQAFIEPAKLLLGEHSTSEVLMESQPIENNEDRSIAMKQEEQEFEQTKDPKEEWIRDTKLYIIRKSNQLQKNHKELRFYHQQIEDLDETLSQDFESNEEVDEQRKHIAKLLSQIQSQGQGQIYTVDHQNLMLKQLQYENQLIQQEKLDYLKKIEQTVEQPNLFQIEQLRMLYNIQRINQLNQLQQQMMPVYQLQPEEIYNITQEDNFVDILESFVRYKGLEDSQISQPNVDQVKQQIEHIDAMRDLWLNADQNLPENVDIGKAFDTIDQAVAVLDEVFRHEKKLENELLEFMQIYNYREEGDASPCPQASNESTKFPLGTNNEIIVNPMCSMINGNEPSFINKVAEQPEINPYEYMKNLQKKPLENDKFPSIIDQIQNLLMINNPFIKAKRLQYFLHKFYTDQIVMHGYKKCKCDECIQMEYPMLIRFDAPDYSLTSQHRWQFDRIQNSDAAFLKTVFSYPKSSRTLIEENQVSLIGQQAHQPIFDALLKQETDFTKLDRANTRLPKLSEVQKSPVQKSPLEISSEINLPTILGVKLQSLINTSVQNWHMDDTYSSEHYKRDTLALQHEFSQLREMQTLVNQMKMAKIQRHANNKNKYLQRKKAREVFMAQGGMQLAFQDDLQQE